MDASEVGRLLTRISELRLLAPGQGDMSAWSDVLHDIRFEDALQAVTDHRAVSSRPVTPDEIADAVHRALDHHRGPGWSNATSGSERSSAVPTPPWTLDARKAAQRAAEACAERSLPSGHPVTLRSCRLAAFEVQRAWEARHGRWDDVWPHWRDAEVPATGTPAGTQESVTPQGRHMTTQVTS